MNHWLLIILLAVVQGVAEFLPISSSGHLVLLSNVADLSDKDSMTVNIVLHAGSLAAIIMIYLKLLLGFFRKDQFRLLLMVIVATIPAGVAGVMLKSAPFFKAVFNDMTSLGLSFMITASLLRMTGKEKMIARSQNDLSDMNWRQAITVGISQAFALLPGISRSGTTISVGILSGIKFEAATAFSFLLALPVIGGACLLEIINACKSGFDVDAFSPLQLGLGFILSAAVSLASLTLLIQIIKKQKLHYFAWYLYALGVGVILWQILKLNGRV